MSKSKTILLIISATFCLLCYIFSVFITYSDVAYEEKSGNNALVEKLSNDPYGLIYLENKVTNKQIVLLAEYDNYYVYFNLYNPFYSEMVDPNNSDWNLEILKQISSFGITHWANGEEIHIYYLIDNIPSVLDSTKVDTDLAVTTVTVLNPFFSNLSDFLLSFSFVFLAIIALFSSIKEDVIRSSKNILHVISLGIITFLAIYFIDFMLAFAISNLNLTSVSMNQLLIEKSYFSDGAILAILSSTLLAPILEELIFRKAFFKVIKNDKVALIVTSLFFGILHLLLESNIVMALIYSISYVGAGFILGLMYLKSNKNIVVPIIGHFLVNLIATISIFV